MKSKRSSPPSPPGLPSQRQLRVGEEMRHALVEILTDHHLADPDLAGKTITITEIRMSPDLKMATIFFLPFGEKGEEKKLTAALNRAHGYFRGRLSRLVNLRFSPRLNFIFDKSFDEAGRIDKLLSDPHVEQDLDDER